MDSKFASYIKGLDKSYEKLLAMKACTIGDITTDCPTGGVYLFSERGKPLYAGRTRRSIKVRLQGHVTPNSEACPFAWRLAREKTGLNDSRKKLLANPTFVTAFKSAKERIKLMKVRYVEEADPTRQALLEIYVAVASGAKHNDFDTH
jgi:hypothetical protein